MEEHLIPSHQADGQMDDSLCINCQQAPFEPGHKINLCPECRNALIKYPIPKWIRFFAIGLIAVIIISLIRTQLYISAAIHLGKGEKAVESKYFVTAQKELAQVLQKFPNDLTANLNMIIASSYNLEGSAAFQAYERVKGKNVEDQDLLAKTTAAMDYIEKFYENDSVMLQKIVKAGNDKTALLKLYERLDSVNGEALLKSNVANFLYDLGEHGEAERICLMILQKEPDFYHALSLMSAIKRESGKYDEALKYCDNLLDINKEDVYAVSQKVRIELKRKHDKKAAEYAALAMQIDANNDSALEAKAMVDYFSGKKRESFASLSTIKAHEATTGDSTISKRLLPIINGSVNYR